MTGGLIDQGLGVGLIGNVVSGGLGLIGEIVNGGFGLGFERLLMWMTGMKNIRDVLPFPRTPGQL